MPLAARRAMSVTFGFRDGEGTESNMLVHMTNPLFAIVDFVGFVEYLTFARTTLPNAAAQLSDADMSYVGIRMSERETTIGSYGSGDAEKKGVFLFTDEQGAPSFRMAIPGIKDSLLAANGRDINLDVDAVSDYIAAFQAGGAGQPVTPNGIQITTPFAAYKQHRQSSTGTRRRTG